MLNDSWFKGDFIFDELTGKEDNIDALSVTSNESEKIKLNPFEFHMIAQELANSGSSKSERELL